MPTISIGLRFCVWVYGRWGITVNLFIHYGYYFLITFYNGLMYRVDVIQLTTRHSALVSDLRSERLCCGRGIGWQIPHALVCSSTRFHWGRTIQRFYIACLNQTNNKILYWQEAHLNTLSLPWG